MQDNFEEQYPEIYQIPFEMVLEADDIELLREYVHVFAIYFGHAVAYKQYDLIEKELKKRTANLDIVEEARNSSAEKALLIGNYCGVLTLMKETMQAHQTLQSVIAFKATELKHKMKPTNDILQYLMQHPNATIEMITSQTGAPTEKTQQLISEMIKMSLIVGQTIDQKIVYSITGTGRLYMSSGIDGSHIYLAAAEEAIQEAAKAWHMDLPEEDTK